MVQRPQASSGQRVRLLIFDPARPIDWLWGISHHLNPGHSFLLLPWPTGKTLSHMHHCMEMDERSSKYVAFGRQLYQISQKGQDDLNQTYCVNLRICLVRLFVISFFFFFRSFNLQQRLFLLVSLIFKRGICHIYYALRAGCGSYFISQKNNCFC